MLAQVLVSPGKLELQSIPKPGCGDDEVLVKMRSAALCNGSDPQIFDGKEGYPTPLVFGHEPFGHIEACGKHVQEYREGEAVTWWFSLGAFAEYAVVNPSNVGMAKVSDWLSPREAPILELVAAAGRAVSTASVSKGDRVLVLGLGPSGLVMSQWLKALGAEAVVGWDLYPMRRDMGAKLGCDLVDTSLNPDAATRVLSAVGEIDIVMDAMGDDVSPQEDTLDKAIATLRQGGRLVTYGHPPSGRRFNPFLFQRKGASLTCAQTTMEQVTQMIYEAQRMIGDGTLDIASLVSEEVSLQDVPRALAQLRSDPNRFLKVIVNVS